MTSGQEISEGVFEYSVSEIGEITPDSVDIDLDILVLSDMKEVIDSNIDEKMPKSLLYHSILSIQEFLHKLQMVLFLRIVVDFDEIEVQQD